MTLRAVNDDSTGSKSCPAQTAGKAATYTAASVGASVTLDPRQVSVDPGGAATVQVKVQNTGDVVDEFVIDVLGEAGPWSTVVPNTLRLLPGREETASVRIMPPRDAHTAAGERPLGVRVQSHEDPHGSVVEEATLAVGVFSETTAELLPRNSRAHRRARHEVAVDNKGNAPLQAEIAASDPDNLLSFAVSPSPVTVAPGTAGFARVRVRARKSFWTGPPKQRPFQVRVQPMGQAPIPLEGAMIQEGLLAGWVLPAAAAVTAIAVLAAAGWFLLLKPAVQSAAKDAVAQPLAQQSAAVANLQKQQASGGGGGGGASPSPSASAGAGTGAPGDSPLGKSFSKRLTPGAASYPVPDKATLSITDVFFENPTPEKGTLQLKRNNEVLLTVNLDNFRDLDYHFVAPLTFAAKETVQVNFACTPTPCANSAVFLNGYQKGP